MKFHLQKCEKCEKCENKSVKSVKKSKCEIELPLYLYNFGNPYDTNLMPIPQPSRMVGVQLLKK